MIKSISKLIIKRKNTIKKFMNNSVYQDLNKFQQGLILIDHILSYLIYGAGVEDYFTYQFYKKKHIDRKTYITNRKGRVISNTFNDENDRKILINKQEFNKVFKDFIGRDWIDISVVDFNTFKEFAIKYGRIFIKPTEGSYGIGIRIEVIDEDTNLEKLYTELLKEKCVIEEVITQDDNLAKFNPSSVNTLRIYTLLDNDGKVKIMGACFRMGNGEKCVDNIQNGGIGAIVDIDTGIVSTPGINGDFDKFIMHPETGIKITGFEIPHWGKIIETVSEVARKLPSIRHIGWDIAISERGKVIIVEGNSRPGFHTVQSLGHVGKWPLYKESL